MNLDLNYACTVEDFQEWVHFEHVQSNAGKPVKRSFSRRTWMLVGILGAILGLGILVPGMVARAAIQGIGRVVYEFLPFVLVPAIVVGWVLFRNFVLKSSAMRTFEAVPELGKPRRAVLTDEGITVETSTSSNTMIWKHFIQIVELKRSFALVATASLPHLLPKRSFASPEQVEEFRQFIASYRQSPGAGFPVQPAARATSEE